MKKRVSYLTELKRIEFIEDLSDADAGKLFKASIRYNDGLAVGELPPSLRPLFKVMKTFYDEKFVARQLECVKQANKIRKRRDKEPLPLTVEYRSIPQYSEGYHSIPLNTDIDIDKDKELELDDISYKSSTSVDDIGKSINKKENIKERYSENFERFWKEYPKKKGKQKAYEAYQNAVKKGVAEEVLIQKAKDFATECHLKHVEDQFIKRPQGWLNEGRYDDEFYTGKKDKKKIDLDDLY